SQDESRCPIQANQNTSAMDTGTRREYEEAKAFLAVQGQLQLLVPIHWQTTVEHLEVQRQVK
ncbi:MAG: hypothetical protein ACKPKO_04330, partial [Candidatus Fonsibacter sp.]